MARPGGHFAKQITDRRQILHDFTYLWTLKTKEMNKHNKQKQIHRCRQQTGGCQRRRGEGD